MVFNPTGSPANATLPVNVYLAGIEGATVSVSREGGAATSLAVSRDYTVGLPVVQLPARAVSGSPSPGKSNPWSPAACATRERFARSSRNKLSRRMLGSSNFLNQLDE